VNERPEPIDDLAQTHAGYKGELSAVLEDVTDLAVRWPPHRTPRYPVHLEGKIVSETGDDPQETFQSYTETKEHKVEVPLFESKKVVCPFNPNTMPGQFYNPAYKKARVLLGADLEKFWIKRYLDW